MLRAVSHLSCGLGPASAFATKEHVFIELDHIRGPELYEVCATMEREGRRFTESQVKSIAVDVLHALAELHALGIAHRDIKPSNIVFEEPLPKIDDKPLSTNMPRAILVDYGLADVMDGQKYSRAGTPLFAPPEAIKGRTQSSKVDMWSFGISMYVAMSLSLPFSSTRQVVNEHEIRFAPQHWQTFSAAAQNFIRSLLRHTPEDRPSAQEALRDPWLIIP